MRERPMDDLANSLTELGANVQSITRYVTRKTIHLPLNIIAGGLRGGKTKIAGDISSQFLSALLMVAPYAQTPIKIELTTELNSKPYVDMTLAVMNDFGVEVQRNRYQSFTIPLSTYQLPTPQFSNSQILQSPVSNLQSPISNYQLPLTNYSIESDASAASYFFAAPAICGGTVKVENISRNSKQGDIRFLDILAQMGCSVEETDNSIIVHGPSSIVGIDVDMRDIPDTAQTLAAIAPFASTPTRIRGIASARHKETDRVHATCAELERLGIQVDEHEDGMTIYPCSTFKPANIQTYNDHRMAMSFSLIGLRFDGVTIENPSCVSKTFPNFFDVLESLR
ncbi:MAG: 3-phosphoshikimate 1-carboxyvinyltransferase, partial [Anaerolineales bacterium]|nr:3-phosphoshikimate 1-carboxyvinyltransferase [Anaerolineales bacterium]